jgi:hypothetical protein
MAPPLVNVRVAPFSVVFSHLPTIKVDGFSFFQSPRGRGSKDSAAYRRYLKKFDDQETEIENLQEAVKKLQLTEQEQRQAYEEFLANLHIK